MRLYWKSINIDYHLLSPSPCLYSVVIVPSIELGHSTCFPLEENGLNIDPCHWNRIHPFPLISWRTRANQRCRLWGHVTSDLWWGCQLVVDTATSGRAAVLYVLAWLKHKHTLLTQSQPVWGRERAERRVGAGWVQEAGEPLQAREIQHDRQRQHM